MTPGISNFVFPAPLRDKIMIHRLTEKVFDLGWELAAVFCEQKNGEIQAFGIFRLTTDTAVKVEMEKIHAAREEAEAVNKRASAMYDEVEKIQQENEKHTVNVARLEELEKHAYISKDIEARLTAVNKELSAGLKVSVKNEQALAAELIKVKESGLNYSSQLNTLKLAHSALEQKYEGLAAQAKHEIKILEKELRSRKKPVMKKARKKISKKPRKKPKR